LSAVKAGDFFPIGVFGDSLTGFLVERLRFDFDRLGQTFEFHTIARHISPKCYAGLSGIPPTLFKVNFEAGNIR
jgi:predicted transcriptional regulator